MAGAVPGLVGAAGGRPAHRGGPGQTRTKEQQMTGNARGGTRILGSLRSADGKGVVRMEDRYDTDIDDLWSAFTDTSRLARWLGEFEGELRLGGEFRARFFASGWGGTGRGEACAPPRGAAGVAASCSLPTSLFSSWVTAMGACRAMTTIPATISVRATIWPTIPAGVL